MAKRDKVEIRHEEIQELLGNPPSWLVKWGISVFAGIITVLIIGSSLFMYPQIIEAPIVMTTEQPPTWVIAKSSGKIDSIYVKNKELVSEGEIIAIIHNTAKVEDVLYLKNLLENDSIEKLNTIQKELQIGELQDSYSLLVKTLQQYEVFNKEQIYELREKAAYEEINSQKMYLKQLEKQSEIYKEAYLISQERYSADSILYKMKALSAKEYEQSLMHKNQDKTRYNQSHLDIISVSIHLAQLNKAIKEYMAEEKREKTEYHTTIMRLYNQLKSNILLWEQTYLLKAPITGLVSYSSFWSKHQHINAGEQSFAVIPHSPGKIIGKCKVPVSGIGKIMPQQEVNIKLDGFPYMEFGTIRGVVENISLIPIRIEQPLKVEYANWVEVSINNLTTTYGKEIPFTGELTGTASITTKEMSLLEHLLSPLKYLWSKKMTNHKHNKTTELENL